MIADPQLPSTAEVRIRAALIGEPERLSGAIELRPYDPQSPRQYAVEADRVAGVLGDGALRMEHVGSTSVPGLTAKPIIDMLLVVADSSDEASCVPTMEQAGYVLRIREPDWYEHRLFKGPDANINLHMRTPRRRWWRRSSRGPRGPRLGRDRHLVEAEAHLVDHRLVDGGEPAALVVATDSRVLGEAVEADVITSTPSRLFDDPLDGATAGTRGVATDREPVEIERVVSR